MIFSTLPDFQMPGQRYTVVGMVFTDRAIRPEEYQEALNQLGQRAANMGAEAIVDIKTISVGQADPRLMITGTAVRPLRPEEFAVYQRTSNVHTRPGFSNQHF